MKTSALWASICLIPSLAMAQPTWQRSGEKEEVRLDLFHAVGIANLPTAETLGKGDFHYEISHRFHPPIEKGYDANFGFDGPVNMRTSLSYGLTDRLMLTLGRSNVLDNLDLQVKYRWLQLAHDQFPSALALCGGIAWSTEMPPIVHRDRTDADNFQYYLQLVYNTVLLDGRLGIGIVPSYLYNSAIFSVDRQYTFTLGNYYQYYIDDMWGLWAEYSPVLSGYQGILAPGEAGRSHDSVAFGISIETGGHFFYLFATNNTRLNPAQYLVGAPSDASPDNWRIAFGITRYL